MTLTVRTIARHIIIMIVILVALTALAISLGLGPVVHSSASLGSISNCSTTQTMPVLIQAANRAHTIEQEERTTPLSAAFGTTVMAGFCRDSRIRP